MSIANCRNYTVNCSRHKQGRYLRATHLPVYPPEKPWKSRPDYGLMLLWKLKEEIIRQIAYTRVRGGKFQVSIPTLEMIE